MTASRAKIRKNRLVGNIVRANYSSVLIDIRFKTNRKINLSIVDGQSNGSTVYTETVKASVIEVRPGIFFMGWKELSGCTVCHLEDFRNEILYTSITLPNHKFISIVGTVKPKISITRRRRPNENESRNEPIVGLNGIKLETSFKTLQSELYFISDSSLYIKPVNDGYLKIPELVFNHKIIQILNGVYLLSWQEEDDTTVVQVLDLARKKVYSSRTGRNKTLETMEGIVKIIR